MKFFKIFLLNKQVNSPFIHFVNKFFIFQQKNHLPTQLKYVHSLSIF